MSHCIKKLLVLYIYFFTQHIILANIPSSQIDYSPKCLIKNLKYKSEYLYAASQKESLFDSNVNYMRDKFLESFSTNRKIYTFKLNRNMSKFNNASLIKNYFVVLIFINN